MEEKDRERGIERLSQDFMEPDIRPGPWIQVEGPQGTELIPADLVGRVGDYLGEQAPIPDALADYCENQTVWSISTVHGWAARLSAPGYLDCTDWAGPFATEEEAEEYLVETYGDEFEEEEESNVQV